MTKLYAYDIERFKAKYFNNENSDLSSCDQLKTKLENIKRKIGRFVKIQGSDLANIEFKNASFFENDKRRLKAK